MPPTATNPQGKQTMFNKPVGINAYRIHIPHRAKGFDGQAIDPEDDELVEMESDTEESVGGSFSSFQSS